MGAGNRVVVEFLGKDTSLSKTAGDVESTTSKLGSRMAKVGKIAALGLAAGTVVAGKALYDMGKAAIEDQQSQKLLEGQLKRSAKATDGQVASVENWITAQGKALGVADDELRPAMAKLVRATGDVGKAQGLAGLAMDASAGTGKSLEAVSTALAKAQNGQVGALGKLGIATKDASGKALSFDEIQKNMAKTFGGAASEKANTLQGRIDRLRLMFDEAKESIGAKLLPVVERLAGWFVNDGLPAISRFSDYLKTNVGPVIQKVRDVIASVFSGSSGDVQGAMESIRIQVSSAVSIVKSLWDRFGANFVTTIRSSFAAVKTIIGGALQIISGIFQTFAAVLRGDWSGAWAGVKRIVSGAWAVIKGVVRLGWSAIKGAFSAGGTAIKALFSGAWNAIKSLARNGASAVVSGIKAIPGKLRALAGVYRSAGRFLINGFVQGMKNAGGVISGIAGNVWSAVKKLLNGAIGRINASIPNKIGKGKLSVDLPDNPFPRFEKGGVVSARSGGIIGQIAEAGHDELIAPISGPNMPAWLKNLENGVGGGDITIVLTLDGKVIHQSLVKRKRETGMSLGLS